ncbi:GGDEF domain-containing protein [Kibdelosporangium aridum]|uniref:Diguanylate cyclase (GGDEF) domain-containing protein n=1 Tax=Kibdelosporangium aridum TaxID=2030 RepID=A0A1W2ADE6_KIBAR|nr:GGDEF domain-containing protein [Kibdelosporangium aridum]SMC58623.1 diguanylate cyclase (GGDEF) domain-containing protein [Kibdelosporangium aridum]
MTNSSSCDSCGYPHGPWATDRLTMLLDRWGWDAQAPRLLAASSSTALVVVDLDNFKRVNDKYGHVAGDAVLKAVADTLRHSTRKGDLLGRYGGHGGDEFLLLLPETTLGEAVVVTERVRQDVRSLIVHAPTEGGTVRIESITASFGVAIGHPDSDLEALIVEADAALRRAKKNGRDRVKAPGRRSLRVPLAIAGACAACLAVVAMVGDAPSAGQVTASGPAPSLPTVTLPPVTVPTTVTMTATVQPPKPAPPTHKPRSTAQAPTSTPTQEPSARAVERPPTTTTTRACPLCDMVNEAVRFLDAR